jgi:uncharacterized protein YbbC (DUF1343 family)
MLADVDVVVLDLRDVGVRCYTYLSTLHYVMEACAAHQCPLIVLDRPNPNGYYVDGPVLDLAFQSFVGKHPIPVVHGMTLGEIACMYDQWRGVAPRSAAVCFDSYCCEELDAPNTLCFAHSSIAQFAQ